MVSKLKQDIGVYREISSVSGVSLKTVHHWCVAPKNRKHKGTARADLRREEFTNFLMQDTITFSHPCKKYAGKKFLMHTWDQVHKCYVQQIEFHQQGMISKTTMRSYKPKSILLSNQTPVNQCLCDYCENCDLIIHALLSTGLKNLPSNKYQCVDSTFCSIRHGQFRTTYRFAPKHCIWRECIECGIEKLRKNIESSNQALLQLNKSLTWHRWQLVSCKSSPMKTEVKGTLCSAVNEFLTIVEEISTHLFRANWNRNIFQYAKMNLMEGHVLQVLDFAMNFNNRYQDEVQSAYWNGMQTTINATVNFYRCLQKGCNEVVTLALVHVSADLKHNSFLARAAMNMTFSYLVEVGVPLNMVLQFCDK